MKHASLLFLCVANSARSQMAEALARAIFGSKLSVQSAGSSPTTVHPFAVEVLREIGIEIPVARSKSVESIDLRNVDLVVTLCDEEVCAALPTGVERRHWPIPDPAVVTGTTESVAGPSMLREETLARFRSARDQIASRLQVLHALYDLPEGPAPQEFHASVRVLDLAKSVRFYAWLFATEPKEWTHRYATFIHPTLGTNFVVVVSDGLELHHDTLYHLGIAVADRAAVIAAGAQAKAAGYPIVKPPRTTWRGTPLHELWLADPDGTLIEVYARLTAEELAQMPADKEPWFLPSAL